jgi:hypothetical protein
MSPSRGSSCAARRDREGAVREGGGTGLSARAHCARSTAHLPHLALAERLHQRLRAARSPRGAPAQEMRRGGSRREPALSLAPPASRTVSRPPLPCAFPHLRRAACPALVRRMARKRQGGGRAVEDGGDRRTGGSKSRPHKAVMKFICRQGCLEAMARTSGLRSAHIRRAPQQDSHRDPLPRAALAPLSPTLSIWNAFGVS